MSSYKVINKMPMGDNTIITVSLPIKKICIGDTINNGLSRIISVAMPNTKKDNGGIKEISLLVKGKFDEEELIY